MNLAVSANLGEEKLLERRRGRAQYPLPFRHSCGLAQRGLQKCLRSFIVRVAGAVEGAMAGTVAERRVCATRQQQSHRFGPPERSRKH
jgi:hypothetical protein